MKLKNTLALLLALGALTACNVPGEVSSGVFPSLPPFSSLEHSSQPTPPSPSSSEKPDSHNQATSTVSETITKENYYDDISDALIGTELLSALSTATSRQFVTHSYNELPLIYQYADVDDTGNMVMFYTGTTRRFSSGSLPSKTNKEHVWPQSWYGAGSEMHAAGSPGADAHNVFPCDAQLNNVRSNDAYDVLPQTEATRVYEGGSSGSYGEGGGGNLNYGDTGNPDSYNYVDKKGKVFYPKEGYRGMTARILMYVATRYYLDSRYPVELVDVAQTSAETGKYGRIGKLSTLLQWNLEEPVTEFEEKRNDVIFERWHKNRNPFVDDSSYACRIWGSTNDATREACATEKIDNKTIKSVFTLPHLNIYLDNRKLRMIKNSI